MTIERKMNWLKRLCVYIILCVYLEPPIFAVDPSFYSLDRVFDLSRIFIFGIMILMILMNTKKNNSLAHFSLSNNSFFLILCFMFVIQFVVTVLYNGNIKTMLISLVTILTPSYFFYRLFKQYRRDACKCVANYLILLCLINLYSQIRYSNGLYVKTNAHGLVNLYYYFLGGENNVITFSLACAFFCTILFSVYKEKCYLFFSIVPLITTFLANSATSYVGYCLFYVLYILDSALLLKQSYKARRFRTNAYIVLVILAVFMCLFSTELSFLSFFIEGVLHKDLTFTGRTRIWKLVLECSLKKPIFGYGLMDSDDLLVLLTASHQHNYYLHILFQGGVVCFLLFVQLLNLARKKIINCEDKKSGSISMAALFAFLMIFITEAYDDSLYILPFYLLLAFIFTLSIGKESKLCSQ